MAKDLTKNNTGGKERSQAFKSRALCSTDSALFLSGFSIDVDYFSQMDTFQKKLIQKRSCRKDREVTVVTAQWLGPGG